MGPQKAAFSLRLQKLGLYPFSSSASGKASTTCAPSSPPSSPRRSLISFSGVAKRYPGGHEALRGVSFTVEAGEFAFVAGHSGAGKSTLLKLIAAIERPSAGAEIGRASCRERV